MQCWGWDTNIALFLPFDFLVSVELSNISKVRGVCTVKRFSQIHRRSLGEIEMFGLAYETAKAVNIHFYLLSKLFIRIFLLYAENSWGSEQVRSLEIAGNMNKQGLSHIFSAPEENSFWHCWEAEENSIFASDIKILSMVIIPIIYNIKKNWQVRWTTFITFMKLHWMSTRT